MKEKNKLKIKNKKQQGITLIALVITIIVLLILAGVSIAMLTGENGILTQARKAKEKTEAAASEEEINLSLLDEYISKYTGNSNLNFLKNLNIKGLYKFEMKTVNVEEKKVEYKFDCIRERNGELFRENITFESTLGSEEANIGAAKVENSSKVDYIEDLAMPLYYLLIEQDTSKIEIKGETENNMIIFYNNNLYEIIYTLSKNLQIMEIKNYIAPKVKELGEYGEDGYGIFMRDINDEILILRNSMMSDPIKASELNSDITKEFTISGRYLISADKKSVYKYFNTSDTIEKLFELDEDKTIKQMINDCILCNDGTVWYFNDTTGTELYKDLDNVEEIYSGYIYKMNDGDIYFIDDYNDIKINITQKFKEEYPNGLQIKKVISDVILTQDGKLIGYSLENDDYEFVETNIKIKDLNGEYFIADTGDLYQFIDIGVLGKIDTNGAKFEKFCISSNGFIQDVDGKICEISFYQGKNNVRQLFAPTEELKVVVGTVEGIVGITNDNELYREGAFGVMPN